LGQRAAITHYRQALPVRSQPEANVGIGDCVSPQPDNKPLKTNRFQGPFVDRILTGKPDFDRKIRSWKRRGSGRRKVAA
jgi:hypothetical protein